MLPLFFCDSAFTKNYKWSGKGQLYDDRNQYHVTCRLTKEKRVDPFFGEDFVKCFKWTAVTMTTSTSNKGR